MCYVCHVLVTLGHMCHMWFTYGYIWVTSFRLWVSSGSLLVHFWFIFGSLLGNFWVTSGHVGYTSGHVMLRSVWHITCSVSLLCLRNVLYINYCMLYIIGLYYRPTPAEKCSYRSIRKANMFKVKTLT